MWPRCSKTNFTTKCLNTFVAHCGFRCMSQLTLCGKTNKILQETEMVMSVVCDSWILILFLLNYALLFLSILWLLLKSWLMAVQNISQPLVGFGMWEFAIVIVKGTLAVAMHMFWLEFLFFSILNLASCWKKESVRWSSNCSHQASNTVLAQRHWRNHCIQWQ